MTQNLTMPEGPKPATQTNYKSAGCMSAVEYFSAQLSYEMSPAALKGMMDMNALKDVCVIDVRAIDAYKMGHVTMALCIPFAELASKMSTLPKDKMIVAYCSDMTCDLAKKACYELAQKGYQCMELCGGFDNWMKKGCPVDKK